MKKCLRINFLSEGSSELVHLFVQKHAKGFQLEGTVQMVEDQQFRVIVCGPKEAVDSFVDALHKGSSSFSLDDIEIEPFLTEKDYRNVFRVIE